VSNGFLEETAVSIGFRRPNTRIVIIRIPKLTLNKKDASSMAMNPRAHIRKDFEVFCIEITG